MNLSIKAIENRYGKYVGAKIGYLTFLRLSPKRLDSYRIIGIFACDCGCMVEYPAGRVLVGGKRTHCGCQTDRGAHRTHGMRYSTEYTVWSAMKGRCLDTNHKDYPKYGGKGITICQEWIDSFELFFQHIGPRIPETSIDRINNKMGYKPGNVRWATRSEQQRNKSTSMMWRIKGIAFETCDEAADHFGVSDTTIRRWVNGAFDRRRNTQTKPRKDCYATRIY